MPKVRRPSPAPSHEPGRIPGILPPVREASPGCGEGMRAHEPDRVPGILRDRHAPPGCNSRSGYPGGALREPNVMGCKILIAAIRA